MNDLISRQAAIDDIKAMYEWHDVVTEDRLIEHIKRLPSAQQWIPVSERLPEINKPVLVWLYDEYYLSELHSIGGVLYWDFDQFDLCGDEFDDVIAWMPLPKPYKEG